MKTQLSRLSVALATLLLLAACASTPAQRIAGNREAFERYPADAQAKIRAGQVAVGFSAEMVLMALGEPDRKYTRKTEEGTQEIWGYRERGPRFGFGLGLGTARGSTAYGASVNTSTGGDFGPDTLRVVLREGFVTAIEDRVR